MKYLLDTNAWIVYFRQNNPQLIQRVLQEKPCGHHLLHGTVVLAELFYGVHHGAVAKLAANLALIARL